VSAAFERYAAARSIAAFERYAAGSTPSAGTLSTLAQQGAPRLGSTRAQSLTKSPGGTPGLGRYFTSSAPSGKGPTGGDDVVVFDSLPDLMSPAARGRRLTAAAPRLKGP